jgi:hypothetical protein
MPSTTSVFAPLQTSLAQQQQQPVSLFSGMPTATSALAPLQAASQAPSSAFVAGASQASWDPKAFLQQQLAAAGAANGNSYVQQNVLQTVGSTGAGGSNTGVLGLNSFYQKQHQQPVQHGQQSQQQPQQHLLQQQASQQYTHLQQQQHTQLRQQLQVQQAHYGSSSSSSMFSNAGQPSTTAPAAAAASVAALQPATSVPAFSNGTTSVLYSTPVGGLGAAQFPGSAASSNPLMYLSSNGGVGSSGQSLVAPQLQALRHVQQQQQQQGGQQVQGSSVVQRPSHQQIHQQLHQQQAAFQQAYAQQRQVHAQGQQGVVVASQQQQQQSAHVQAAAAPEVVAAQLYASVPQKAAAASAPAPAEDDLNELMDLLCVS